MGLPDERFGQPAVAVASLKDGQEIDEASLIEQIRQHLAGYKLPKQVLFVAEV